jgi:hypothetical protein
MQKHLSVQKVDQRCGMRNHRKLTAIDSTQSTAGIDSGPTDLTKLFCFLKKIHLIQRLNGILFL